MQQSTAWTTEHAIQRRTSAEEVDLDVWSHRLILSTPWPPRMCLYEQSPLFSPLFLLKAFHYFRFPAPPSLT